MTLMVVAILQAICHEILEENTLLIVAATECLSYYCHR